jgi:phytanoyl-CoA dioxygenase PhyH
VSASTILTPAQRRHFLEKGYVILKGCFTKKAAAPWIADAYARLGCDPRDRSTWKEEKCALPGTRAVMVDDFAPRAFEATCELIGGEDRLLGGRSKLSWSDSFLIKFPCGDPAAADIPATHRHWHIDGAEVHYLDDPVGLLNYVVWSDLKPRGGGTFLVPDSIGRIARLLAARPEGVDRAEISRAAREMVADAEEVVELTGKTGDVVLAHPFMLHSESRNIAAPPRFFTVRGVDLGERLNFNRGAKNEFSLVETAVLNALGVERLDFKRK